MELMSVLSWVVTVARLAIASAIVEARLETASDARKKRVEETRMSMEVGQGVL
jgi:hypothetical protein